MIYWFLICSLFLGFVDGMVLYRAIRIWGFVSFLVYLSFCWILGEVEWRFVGIWKKIRDGFSEYYNGFLRIWSGNFNWACDWVLSVHLLPTKWCQGLSLSLSLSLDLSKFGSNWFSSFYFLCLLFSYCLQPLWYEYV